MSRAGEGSAHGSSVPHWWHQRVTAVALIPLGLWLGLSLPGLDLGSQAAVIAWMREPMTAILLGLLALCAAYHSWLGVGEVLEEGADLLLVGFGPIVQRLRAAAAVLRGAGLAATVINARWAKPLDAELLARHAAAKRLVVTAEESAAMGGFGDGVLDALNQAGIRAPVLKIALAEPLEVTEHRDHLGSLGFGIGVFPDQIGHAHPEQVGKLHHQLDRVRRGHPVARR